MHFLYIVSANEIVQQYTRICAKNCLALALNRESTLGEVLNFMKVKQKGL